MTIPSRKMAQNLKNCVFYVLWRVWSNAAWCGCGRGCRVVCVTWRRVVQCVIIDDKGHILPHSPPMGVPILWQRWSVYSHVSHFLVSNVQSKFYLLLFFFSSSFPISNSKTWPFFFFSVCCHTTPQRFEKKAQNGKIEKTQSTHIHTQQQQKEPSSSTCSVKHWLELERWK